VRVITFDAPWTAFKNKYRLWQWPWKEMFKLRKQLAAEHFDVAISARWDPRDHLLLKIFGAKKRFGFPRLDSGFLLSRALAHPGPQAHRYEFWRSAGKALGIDLPVRRQIVPMSRQPSQLALVHSGARLPARIWPLERFNVIVKRLRENGYAVQVVCDPSQQEWWKKNGETDAQCPRTLFELFVLLDKAGVFIGNDSGPGHLAAISGIPTFTFFGPSLPQWFAPIHPKAEWLDDKSCPFKPCKDYCRFSSPRCLENIQLEEAWAAVKKFVEANLV
jgi:ADP-heptose:LPS heptosyltransferase